MKRSPLILITLLLLASFTISMSQPAFAGEFKWYNPGSWWYDNGRPSKERAKAREEAEKAEKEASQPSEETAKEKEEKTRSRWSFRRKDKKDKKAEEAEKKEKSKKASKKKKRKHGGKEEIGAVIETEKGNITIRLYSKDAPVTVENFKELVEGKFYNKPGMKFHRVVEGFVIQTGDPTGTGYGGSGHKIPLEVKNKLSHDGKGVVAMARGPLPNSATSQFYITLSKHTQLDGKYAIFGQVIRGLQTLDKIKKDDKLYGIKLIDVSAILPEKRPEDQSTFNKIFGNFDKSDD